MSDIKRIRRHRITQEDDSNNKAKRRSSRAKPRPVVIDHKPKRRSSHVKPRPPVIDINFPGRLRTANILALFGISHSTLYTRLKSGAFPPADGSDGKLKFWNTQTIRPLL